MLISSACFFMSRQTLSWFTKMELVNPILISAKRFVKASNLHIEMLSLYRTSAVRFQYSSVRNSFTIVSLLLNNKSKAPKKDAEARPVYFVWKNFAESSFRFSFSPLMPGRISPSGTSRCPVDRAIYRLRSKTLQRNQTVPWHFGRL